MDLIARYRNVALLVAALIAQLILLGYQVRRDDGSMLLRTWAVALVAPMDSLLHAGFDGGSSVIRNYVWLVGARQENEEMRRRLDQMRLENQSLALELGRLERSRTLLDYRASSPSVTVAAEVIGGGGANFSEVLLDRGRDDGVLPGMAVVTADGIVGEVKASHAGSALVVLINDRNAAVGGILGASRVHGIVEGGGAECRLKYVAHEVEVTLGETVYTSGEDRIFPKGLRVGRVSRLGEGGEFREIFVRPFAQLDRLDEVLVVTAGVHSSLPERPQPPASLLPAPGGELTRAPVEGALSAAEEADLTDADRVRRRYRELGEAQGHTFGEGVPGSSPPDFNAGHPSSQAPDEAEPLPAADAAASLEGQP